MTSWREHPKLQGRFHPDGPDDLQVIVHDGHPAISGRRPKLVWVRVTGSEDETLTGVVLNRPAHLRSVGERTEIVFIIPGGGEYPVQVTREYLAQRDSWRLLMACKKCGLTELLSPARELVAATFPGVGDDQLRRGFTFTTRCGWCGGAKSCGSSDYPLPRSTARVACPLRGEGTPRHPRAAGQGGRAVGGGAEPGVGAKLKTTQRGPI
jgi:hypothetical protein